MLYSRLIYSTIAGVFLLALGGFCLYRDSSARVNRVFAVFLFSLGIWDMAGYALLAGNPKTGVFLYRILNMSGPIALASFTLFSQLLLGIENNKLAVSCRRVVYGFSAVMLPLHFTNLIVRDFTYVPGEAVAFSVSSGPLYPVMHGAFALLFLISAVITYQHMRLATGNKRNQLKYIFLAWVIGSMAVVFIVLRSLGMWAPIWTYFSTQMISTFCFAYIIFKYELFEFDVWMRRASIFIGVYGLILGMPFFLFPFYVKWIDTWNHSNVVLPVSFAIYGTLCALAPGFTAFLRDKAEERLKKDLISNITHEFKGPLNNMENALEILSKEMRKENVNKSEAQEFLTMAGKNAERLGHFIQNLLEVAKIDRPDISVQRQECRIDAILDECLKSVEMEVKNKNLKVQRDFPSMISVQADLEKLRQVFSNLLTNAVKYTDAGLITVTARTQGSKIVVAIKDTGAGIKSEYLSSVFERFFRTPETKQTSIRGTGLGLSIVKGWVEAHGGRIWAESEGIGKGSTFIVELPA